MKRRLAHIALAFACALALGAAAPLGAEQIKILQGMDFSLGGNEFQANGSSPFTRTQVSANWSLYPSLDADYNLRFQGEAGVSGQLAASIQGATSTSLAAELDQAWVRAAFGEGWGIAFGRRNLKDWKDGGYWNPSDIVNNYLPWGIVGASGVQIPGKDSIELLGLLPFTDLNVDLNAATVLPPGIDSPASLPFYFTAGSIFEPFELRLKAAFQSGRLPYVGASAHVTLRSGSLYADGLWLQDQPIAAAFGLGPSTGSWFRYCAGAQWNIDISQSRLAQSLFLQAEYLRQDDALDASQMSGFFDALAAMPLANSSDGAAYGAAAKIWNSRFFALGRDYLYAAFYLGEIANAHIGLFESCVLNIDDLSFGLMSSLAWSPRNLFSISFSASNYGGRAGGEAFMLPYAAQYTLSRSF